MVLGGRNVTFLLNSYKILYMYIFMIKLNYEKFRTKCKRDI